MRFSIVGAFIGASFVMLVAALPSSSEPVSGSTLELPAHSKASGELIAHVSAAEGQAPIVTVIDPRQRVLAIYHVDRSTGAITPKSVRNITWDLQMIHFNSGEPLPQDIKNGLQR